MSIVQIKPNVKLAKIMYKYAEEVKEDQKSKEEQEEKKPVEKEDYESYPPYNFSWIVKDKVAAMGWPQTIANLNYLVDVGINHLVTLSPERVPPMLEFKRKLKWTEIGVREFGVPTLKQIIKFVEICDRADTRGEVVGVHCRQGIGRTGTMLACYLVYSKHMTPERAILTLRLERPGSCETYEQEKIVCHYHDCLRGTISKIDYNMVENKFYFDLSMKYMFGEENNGKQLENGSKQLENGSKQLENGGKQIENGGEKSQDGEKNIPETKKGKNVKKVTICDRKKSKAMVINHKIYF